MSDDELFEDLLRLREESTPNDTADETNATTPTGRPQTTKIERGLRRIGAIPPSEYRGKKAAAKAPPAPRQVKQIVATLTKQGILINLADILKYVNMDKYMKMQEQLTHVYLSTNGRKVVGKLTMRLFRIHTVADTNGQTRRLFACARFCGIARVLREACLSYDLRLKIENKVLPGSNISIKKAECTIKLTENQQLVMDYLMNNVFSPARQANGSSGCVFVMDTGHGKSYIAAKLIAKLRKKTLLIIPSESIMNGWTDLFKKWMPNLSVGKYYSREKADGDVVLMVINSALQNHFMVRDVDLTWTEYMNQFGLVIYDEIHNYPTAGRQEIFWRCGFRCLFGMTATPDERIDEMDVIYTKHIGPLVNAPEVPGYNHEEIEWKGMIKVIQYSGHPDYTKRITGYDGVTNTTGMYKQFCSDPYRNLMVLEEIRTMQTDGLDVFCFSEHREYLEYLYGLLTEMGMAAEAPEIGSTKGSVTKLMGGSTVEDHKRAHHSQIVLVTYAYAKEGISIVKMNGMIFTTPRRRKMRQILGRILRRGGDPSIVRRIVDITDANTPLRGQLKTRKEEYARRGFPVTEVNVSWKKYEEQVKVQAIKHGAEEQAKTQVGTLAVAQAGTQVAKPEAKERVKIQVGMPAVKPNAMTKVNTLAKK